MTKKIKITICSFILLSYNGLFAQKIADSLTGIWKSRGYGKIIDIQDTLINSYEVTAISCTLSSQLKRSDISKLGTVKRVSQDILTITEGIKVYTLDKIEELPKSVEYSITKSEDPNFNFNVFWNMMNENYPFFKERKMNWASTKEKYQKQNIRNKGELSRIIKRIIRELNDGHTSLIIPKKNGEFPHYRANNKTAILEDKILQYYVKNPVRFGTSIKGSGLLNYGITGNNVGYIQINNMMFFSYKYKNPRSLTGYDYLFDYLKMSEGNPKHFEDEKRGINVLMGKIIEELQGTKAIILDLRFNLGGYDMVSLEILRHFIAEETKLFSKKAKLIDGYTEQQFFSVAPAKRTYNKPVFLLISHQTASAPEILALSSMSVKT
ncbi:S41 family peptidase [Epilithonimonas mollis]|uniref:S41 family peptidase n=1 Tax=Epilithonimonas mollis TaxID=216903 RepID=UPI000934AD43|nr:S41 family peptidase [Epilithonimonas mollis]